MAETRPRSVRSLLARISSVPVLSGIVFIITLSLLPASCLFFDAPPARAEARTVTVGVYENAPKVFTAESGAPSGIFIDIIEHIAKSEGWNLRYVSGTWAEGLDRLAGGEIDLMPDVAYTTERKKNFTFHKIPVLSSWSQVYVPKGSGLRSILDLNGKRIAVLEQSVQQETFARMANSFGLDITLVSVPDYKTMFTAVARGEADAAVTNRFYGLLHAKKLGFEDTAVMFEPAELFFATAKNDPKQLLASIDSRLADMKKDTKSAYYSSIKRWTSEEVKFKAPAWLHMLGLALCVALLMSLVGSVLLKHQVTVRTRELHRINQEMEQRIATRTMELTEANKKLQELDRLKSMFIASMSHELRTPLNSIIGFTGITLQGLSGPINDEQRDNLSRVSQSAKHLLALITDVIDISKIEAGRIDAYPETVSLQKVLTEAINSVAPQLKEKQLALEVKQDRDIELHTDRKRLLQCLINLLSNAVKFTEQGGITLAVREEQGGVEIAVTDTGIGIAEADLPKLFEAFERLETHLRVKAGGTGLGLYLTKKLANDILHGAVSVRSTEGIGSTFTLHVPRNLTQAAAAQGGAVS